VSCTKLAARRGALRQLPAARHGALTWCSDVVQ
jgi:hypothetical protein